MSFKDRYKRSAQPRTQAPAEPQGNVVIETTGRTYEGSTMIVTGKVISGRGVDQEFKFKMSDDQEKMIRAGLMKHAAEVGAQFALNGVKKVGDAFVSRRITLVSADVTKEKNGVSHNVVMTPSIVFSKDNATEVTRLAIRFMDPTKPQDAGSSIASISEKVEEILKNQEANGFTDHGVVLVIKSGAEDTNAHVITDVRRDVKVGDDYVPESIEEARDRIVKRVIHGTAKGDLTADVIAQADADMVEADVTVNAYDLQQYPVIGDSFGVEAADIAKFLESGGEGFSKMSTTMFLQKDIRARVEAMLGSKGIEDDTRDAFIGNLRQSLSAEGVKKFDKDGISAIPFRDFAQFVEAVGMELPERGSEFNTTWGRSTVVVGESTAPKSKGLKIAVGVFPTVTSGTPVPHLPETRGTIQENFEWAKKFIEAGAEYHPTKDASKEAAQPEADQPGDLGADELGADDLGTDDLGM